MTDEIDVRKLGPSPVVAELDDEQCARLADRMHAIRLADGEVLVEEGERNLRLFLLVRGQLEVVATRSGEREIVHVMHSGECAGTRAFVDRSPRRATLRARGEAEVYGLLPEDFEALIDSDPWLVYRVMRAIFRITHRNLLRMNEEASELANYVMKAHGRY